MQFCGEILRTKVELNLESVFVCVKVQYNLFERYAGKTGDAVDSKDVSNRSHFLCHDIEEAFLKHAAEHAKPCFDTSEHIKPRFYDIASADYNAQVGWFFCSY